MINFCILVIVLNCIVLYDVRKVVKRMYYYIKVFYGMCFFFIIEVYGLGIVFNVKVIN